MTDVSVVIVSYESRELLERCFGALDADVPHTASRELIVVDQASGDGTAQWLRSTRPDVRLVALDRNVGFGAGNNHGARVAGGRWLLLLNSDAFVDPGAIDELVHFADRRPAIAAVGPRLHNADGSLQRSCRGFPSVWRIATEYLFLRKLRPHSRLVNSFYCGGFAHDEPRRVDWLTGAVLLVRRADFEAAGGFDEAFFMYSEEVDLMRRLADRGRETWFDPAAGVTHLWGGTTSRDPGRNYREQLRSHVRYLDRHHGPAAARRGRLVLLAGCSLRAPYSPGHRQALRWLRGQSVEELLR